jgi:hypothetical protein
MDLLVERPNRRRPRRSGPRQLDESFGSASRVDVPGVVLVSGAGCASYGCPALRDALLRTDVLHGPGKRSPDACPQGEPAA